MLSADEREKLERGFRAGEASLRLEGQELEEPYWNVKSRVLAGEITLEQGLDEIDAHHQAKAFVAA
jgi:hypothetical protein